MNTTVNQEIVVLGGGYTGVLATVRLARRTRRAKVRITLVNPSDRFVERLRMHQIAAGQQLANRRITELLDGTGARFHRAAATGIDPAARQVTLSDGATLHYDTLVYALGSATDTERVPGVADHAWTLNDPVRAHHFSERLTELAMAGGTVTVVGGGLTGVEAATEIAESHPDLPVTLVAAAEPGSMMGPGARAHLDRAFERLGIVRRIGVQVDKVLPQAIRLSTGELIASDLTLWTAGVRVPPLAADAGIATDATGSVITDATLRSVSHPDVYAIGDAASVVQPFGRLHGTCQSGMPTAAYVADAIARRLRGREVPPFRFGYVHQPVSLGRRDAVIQFTNADDTPKRWYLTGRVAVRYKDIVSGSPWPVFGMSTRMTVPVQFSRGGRRTRDRV
ncbi:NAD(P)/FAD-dependent oxidoreductase [Nocardia miyunensis]|uniref:NAD(P)/FAD-dependent oxidoreductase n=1 Tax=Nocardia miyunensis TaxID=282684 RepID=UPI000835D857|nr:FAD-dependent oxidoreductase [Nocardia miyunensis]